MPICIHAGGSNLDHHDLFAQDVLARFKHLAVGVFNKLTYKGIAEMFPKLRWCFVENRPPSFPRTHTRRRRCPHVARAILNRFWRVRPTAAAAAER